MKIRRRVYDMMSSPSHHATHDEHTFIPTRHNILNPYQIPVTLVCLASLSLSVSLIQSLSISMCVKRTNFSYEFKSW